jgi:hypothetical protein
MLILHFKNFLKFHNKLSLEISFWKIKQYMINI